MSYSRSFSKTIAIHYSGSVSYPASQSGGSVSYSGTAYEDVVVNINVDTDAFDSSVRHCNNSVGALTGAVVATEGAQVASIRQNAIKIGQTIVDGFFSTVRSEISQQITELKNRIDADLIHLNELAKRCVDKQRQMESDYNRISGRYLKIFSDLDNELDNRIHEIDRPVFEFRQRTGRSRAAGGAACKMNNKRKEKHYEEKIYGSGVSCNVGNGGDSRMRIRQLCEQHIRQYGRGFRRRDQPGGRRGRKGDYHVVSGKCLHDTGIRSAGCRFQ